MKFLTFLLAVASVGFGAGYAIAKGKPNAPQEVFCAKAMQGFELQSVHMHPDRTVCIYQEDRTANKLRRLAEAKAKVPAGSLRHPLFGQ